MTGTSSDVAAAATRLGEAFAHVVDGAMATLTGDEILVANLAAETSDFVRFSGSTVGRAGSVEQRRLVVDLADGRRHARGSLTLGSDPHDDVARVRALLTELREQRDVLPEDPYLLHASGITGTHRVGAAALAEPADAVDALVSASRGRDLAGIYAAGAVHRGFASSTGLRHWYSTGTFNLDWSAYVDGDRAAKTTYTGTHWDDDDLGHRITWSDRQLDALRRPLVTLAPGSHRVYLAPAAMAELLDLLAWGGFGLLAHRTRQTPLLRMVTGDATFHPSVTIREDVIGGTAPGFQQDGFVKPDEVVLVREGHLAAHLVSPRSAQEYGVPTNGAEDGEYPVAVRVDTGSVPAHSVTEQLGTGLYVGNLWYLNYSDRAACRATGMTRFATFWVEDGEVVAPVDVLRFDDTVYDLLGHRLEGLSDQAEIILDPGTYGERSTASSRVPGALIAEMRFTL